MPLKCRCVCGCKLMVSLGSVGKSIKCPKCDRRLRVPKNAIAQRREQLAKKQAKANPKPKRAKLQTRLSSLVDVPDPEPPPIFEADIDKLPEPALETRPKAKVEKPKEADATKPREAKVEKPRDSRSKKNRKKNKKRKAEENQKIQLDPPPIVDDPAAKDSAAKDTAAKDTAAKDTAAKDTAAKDTAAKDTAAKDTAAKDTAAKDAAAKDTAAKDTAAKDTAARDPVAEEAGGKTTESRDQSASDSVPKPPPREKTTPVAEADRKGAAAVEQSPGPDRTAEPEKPRGLREPSESDWNALGGVREPVAKSKERDKGRPKEEVKPPSRETPEELNPQAAFSEPEAPEAEPPPLQSLEEDVPVHGYQADRDKVATVRWLAAALLAISLFGMIPAGREIAEHFRIEDGSLLNRWVYASLLICGLQLAYAGYLAQLPDWSSVWVVTIFSLIVASAYAAMLCLTLLAGADSQFVQVLDLAERLRGGKATGWCFVMLCMTGLLAYTSGRVGSRWRQAFAM